MPLPTAFLDHLRAEGYHPRSNKHSNVLAVAIVDDLARACAALARKAEAGVLVYDLNFDLRVRTATWNVDLVVGRPAQPVPPQGAAISRAPPATTEIAIEIKSVMTEHRKAVKNRKRDLEAHHEHVHNYNDAAIAGGVLVVNEALVFRSPLRRGDTTTHGRDRRAVAALVEHCLTEMRNVAERRDVGAEGMDAKCTIVVDMDNIDLARTIYVERAPAPRPGDPLNYDSFLQRVCDLYARRFP